MIFYVIIARPPADTTFQPAVYARGEARRVLMI